MRIVGVRVELPGNTPVLLLQENEPDGRMLPIFIGQAEATAIALALEDVETPRPMTHDLVRDLLMVLGTTLDKVVITDLRDKTFFAEMHLSAGSGEQIVSSRPSDALAIAVRTDSPVFAEPHVLDAAGFQPDPEDLVGDDDGDDDDEEEVLDEFRDFIDNVNPEDFAG